jgi:outer membrane protein OmpA-like peptidoglycan-associated protein
MRAPSANGFGSPLGRRARIAAAAGVGAALFASVACPQRLEQGVAIVSETIASRVDGFSYQPDSSSELDFRGSTLAPRAAGKIKVRTSSARTEIDARLEHMPAASSLGPFVVYVLWVITAQGQPHNVGVVEMDGDRGRILATTPLSSFALIVTAEPHFAVTAPSKYLVLQSVGTHVQGVPLVVTSLTARADYDSLKPVPVDPKHPAPAELVMAHYAVAIAESADAPHLAPESYQRAKAALTTAEQALGSKKSADRASVPELSREAIQAGEDARAAAETRRGGTALESLRQQLAAQDAKLKESAEREASAHREVAALETRVRAAESHLSAASRQELATQLLSRWLVLDPVEGAALAAHISSDEGFVKGRLDMTPATRERLSLVAGILLGIGNVSVSVTPALQLSEEPAKLALSQKRARAVMEWLASVGISAAAGVPLPSTEAAEKALAPGPGVDLLISFEAEPAPAPAAAGQAPAAH